VHDPLGVRVALGVIDGVAVILGVTVLVGVIDGVLLIEILGVNDGVILGVPEIETEIEGVTLGGIQTVDVATTPDVVIWNALAGVVNGAVAIPYHSRLPFHNESKLALE
jgi:hypothetical protein